MVKNSLILVASALLLSSCSNFSYPKTDSDEFPLSNESSINTPDYSSYSILDVDSSEFSIESSDEASEITNLSNSSISYDSNTFLITGPGSFDFTGNFMGCIQIEAGDEDEIELVFNSFNIENTTDAPIKCLSAGELKIKLLEGTTNNVIDSRDLNSINPDDVVAKGAIYAKSDLKFTSKGNLKIKTDFNNGIHTTKDIKLKNSGTIQIEAKNHAIKGNDSITLEQGNVIAIAKSGSGLKTENTDVSSKGNQRGSITIQGGQLDIYSCEDGIEASYNVEIENDPIINIFTSNYSTYSKEVVETSSDKMYLKTTTSYSSSYRYSVLFKDSSSSTSWVNASYLKSQNEGRGKNYAYYELKKPADSTSFKIFKFLNSKDNKEEDASCSMNNWSNLNSNYDTVVFRDNYSSISVESWTTYSTQQSNPGGGGFGPGGGFDQGNTDKASYSAKGIKAENEIKISGGEISVKAYDDTIHASYGTSFDNGSTGIGDVTISGGTLNLYAADDALHADRYLNITGGTVNVTSAYEGLEGNQIKISGGHTTVYALDDGLNAAKKANLTPLIEVSGGIVDVAVYGGDVDGIDSNGNFSQTGGIVITKGGTGGMSTGLDVDGTSTVSGGSFICFGKPEKTPTTKGSVTSKTYSGNYSKGNYTINIEDTEIKTTTYYTYSIIYVFSVAASSFTISKN